MADQTGDFSQILTLLKDNPRGMSVTEIAESAHLNRNTIARYMDTLLVSGRVEMRTFGKAKVFFISKRVPVSAMLNLSSEMVILISSDLKVIQANESIVHFLSCSKEDIVGKYVYEGKCKTFCNDVLSDQIRRAVQGEMIKGEIRLIRNGSDCILDQRIYPMVLPDGRPGVSVVFDDITEKENAKAALEQSESMFRRLVETVSDVIWSLDENSTIQYISPQIKNVTGYTSEELIGKKFSDLMPKGAAARFLWELSSELSRENGFEIPEFPMLCKDGRKIYCEFSGTPVTIKGEDEVFMGYNGAMRDVSEQRRAERGAKRWKYFLDGVIDNIPSIITVTDIKSGQYYYVNKSAEEALHITKAEFANLKSGEVLKSMGSVSLTRANDTAASLKRPEYVAEDEIKINGKTRYISARIFPMALSVDREYLITIIDNISDEVADRKRQLLSRELAFTMESVSTISEMTAPIIEMLPKISGFESVAFYQRSIFDDFVLMKSNGQGKFAPAVVTDSIIDRVMKKGEPAIFDKYRMGLLPENSETMMTGVKSLVLMPIVFEGRTVASIVIASKHSLSPDASLRSLLVSIAFQISAVASRCLLREKLERECSRTAKYLDAARVIVAAINSDGNIEMINAFGADLLGYHKSELLGRNWFETVVPTDLRKQRTDVFEMVISNACVSEDNVFRGKLVSRSGEEIGVLWKCSVMTDEEKNVDGILITGDIV
ncbi:MAG: PAS domain S-box protein [Methanocorpusculum sp.]|nr:PAS domain S-box protein [Methanocorpusculum sp.]